MKLVANGDGNVTIGEKLGISPKTVARHRERIMGKLDIHSTTELVKIAIRAGMVDIH
jgi:DNA-binding NarL/FixJ family response regulator